MNLLSIRNILLGGTISIILIWGAILSLALTDKSFQLFIPSIPTFSWFKTEPALQIDLPKDGPWRQDLFMGSGDLSNFGGKSFLVHGSATPSAIFKNGEVVVYFNYYPASNRKAFGSISWIKSSDLGRKWTSPAAIHISSLPELATNPVSPQVVALPSGKIKLYFIAKKINQERNILMAALSNDGVNFVFDPTTSFEIEDESLVSFSLTILQDRMHLIAFTREGQQSNMSYNAISYDTKVFTRLADIKIAETFYGQASLVSDGKELKLLGASPKGLWSSTSTNGNTWSDPSYYNLSVQNPSTVLVGEKYLLFYTADTNPQTSPQ
jgi:hypothetical protein